MRLFLDTSLLVKLYYEEEGTAELDEFLNANVIEAIYLSEISKVEFNSALWKKVRTKELEEADAVVLQKGFRDDYDQYQFIRISSDIVDRASDLILKYGSMGLRTLDAIQLSCAIEQRSDLSHAKSADRILEELFSLEKIAHQ